LKYSILPNKLDFCSNNCIILGIEKKNESFEIILEYSAELNKISCSKGNPSRQRILSLFEMEHLINLASHESFVRS